MLMNTLTNDQLRRAAPSIFATQPWHGVSDKYAFIPTIDIVDALREEGFMPVLATQSPARIAGKGDYTKHMLRFRREQDMLPRVVDGNAHHIYAKGQQPEVPEIVLVNSHDRSSGFNINAGLYRLVCSNGLVVQSASFDSIRVRHMGANTKDEVIEGSFRIIEEMPVILEQMAEMKQVKLEPEQQRAYAEAALQLRWPLDDAGSATSPVMPGDLLRVRRIEDAGNDLWSTFNRVQENFIKGGLRGVGTTGKRLRTRAIKSVGEDLRLNKALWTLTEKMGQLLAA